MAFSVYQAGSNTGNSEESTLDSEKDRLLAGLGGRMANFIISPFSQGDFDITTSGSSLDVDIAAGDAFAGGHLVRSDATVTKTLNASVTSEIFLVVRDGASGNAEIVAQDKSTADPTGQYVLKLWEATTDSSGVTGTTDFRKYVPYPNLDPVESITGLKETSQGTPDPPSVGTGSTGIKTVSVSFSHPYQVSVFSVVASLDTLTDTAVNLGWIRTKNVTTSGFDIEAKVTKAGASGSSAEFHWIAQGQ